MAESPGGSGNGQAPLPDDCPPISMDVQSMQGSVVTVYGLGSLSMAQNTEVVLDSGQQDEVLQQLRNWHTRANYNVEDRGPYFMRFFHEILDHPQDRRAACLLFRVGDPRQPCKSCPEDLAPCASCNGVTIHCLSCCDSPTYRGGRF
jgi:hypothetical protein